MKTKEEMSYELCSQLHKQYAEADNNKIKNLFGFITALAFIFGGYGIFLKDYLVKNNSNYDDGIFFAISSIVLVLTVAISVLIVIFGYTQRRDQFIIFKIRGYFFTGKINNLFHNVFVPEGKSFFSYLPDHYLILFISCFFVEAFMCAFILCECKNKNICSQLLCFMPLIISFLFYLFYFNKYKIFEKRVNGYNINNCCKYLLKFLLIICFIIYFISGFNLINNYINQ